MKIIGVYGTLRKGEGANHKLNSCEYIGVFRAKIPFQMYNLGWYPCLSNSEEENEISLELYNVDEKTEKVLDYYEEYPILYHKNIIKIENMDVTIYVISKTPLNGDIIKSGDWLNQ